MRESIANNINQSHCVPSFKKMKEMVFRVFRVFRVWNRGTCIDSELHTMKATGTPNCVCTSFTKRVNRYAEVNLLSFSGSGFNDFTVLCVESIHTILVLLRITLKTIHVKHSLMWVYDRECSIISQLPKTVPSVGTWCSRQTWKGLQHRRSRQ